MPDYQDHKAVIILLQEDQDADQDRREKAREAHRFIKDENGQWEDRIYNQDSAAPKYQFDLTTPIVDRVAGAFDKLEMGINVSPNGGNADDEVATTYQGLIRNIQNISNAHQVFNHAARSMITCGLDGWRLVQKYVDGNSFDQDLMIEPITNFLDRVWFDYGAELQDKSDATRCFVLTSIPTEEYNERWPDRNASSLGTGREFETDRDRGDFVVVGEIYYVEKSKRELVLYNNGITLAVDDEFEAANDELLKLGVQEIKRRERSYKRVFVRRLDQDGWIGEARETVFDFIPVVPAIANFEIFNDENVYFGVIQNLIDSQRVLNYSASREVAEGALAPRAKYWMTKKQVAGHEAELATMNTNQDPVALFNVDPGNPGPPQQSGGAMVNPGLARTTEFSKMAIGETASLFAANLGDNPGLQSGVAIKELKSSGDIGSIKYVTAMEVAVCHTWRILKNAIPKVYEPKRQVRIVGEDGKSEMVTIGEKIINDQGQKVTINNLRTGEYDVVCVAGPSFKSRQSETIAALNEVAAIDPAMMQQSGDIFWANLNFPGSQDIAERKRQELLKAGMIPESQMTDEEKQQAQLAAQQPQQPDAMMVAAQAEQAKADAEMAKVQLAQTTLQINAAEKDQQLQLKAKELELKEIELQIQAAKMQSGQGNEEFNSMLALAKQQSADQKAAIDNLNTQAKTLKTIREAMGVESIVGPGNTKAYIDQAEGVQEAQALT